MSTTSCSPPDLLARWLRDEVDAASGHQLEQHIQTCTECQAELERLTRCRLSAATVQPLSDRLQRFADAGLSDSDGTAERSEKLSAASDGARQDSGTIPVLPGYEILRLVGSGGMGRVYLARQIELERLVAVKVVSEQLSTDASFVARLKQEARALAAVRHPNVVQIHDVADSKGRPAIVLEYLADGSLAQLVRQQPISVETACRIMQQVARGVHAIHQRGIIHRDLKPGNILMDGEVPKVADFGLAMFALSNERLTTTRDVFGTPEYMAPEQIREGARECSAQSDVYTLGAILFELLTGQPPFVGRNAFQTMELVANQTPPLPSQICPEVPRVLDEVCRRALARTPADRYESAEQFADALARATEVPGFENAASFEPSCVPAAASGRSFLRRPRVRVMGTLLVLAAAFVVWKSYRDKESPESSSKVAGGDADAAERQSSAADSPGAGDNPPVATTEWFPAGSHWIGTYAFLPAPDGQVDGNAEVIIESRDGDNFTAIYYAVQRTYAWKISGVVRGHQVEWQYTTAIRDNESKDVVGRTWVSGLLTGSELNAVWRQEDETCRLTFHRISEDASPPGPGD